MLKAIIKYRNHPSIKAIDIIQNSNNISPFRNASKDEAFREVASLDMSKAYQNSDIRAKTNIDNADIFQVSTTHHLN